jgi:hypothetical protein
MQEEDQEKWKGKNKRVIQKYCTTIYRTSIHFSFIQIHHHKSLYAIDKFHWTTFNTAPKKLGSWLGLSSSFIHGFIHGRHTRLPYENNICLVQSIKNGGMFIATIETLTLNNPICEDFSFFFSSVFYFLCVCVGKKDGEVV